MSFLVFASNAFAKDVMNEEKENEEKENDESPFLSLKETLAYLLRTIFMSGEISPDILHKATGVDIETCIDFSTKCLKAYLYGNPPDIGKEE